MAPLPSSFSMTNGPSFWPISIMVRHLKQGINPQISQISQIEELI
jgi:hypothetical protein